MTINNLQQLNQKIADDYWDDCIEALEEMRMYLNKILVNIRELREIEDEG